MFTTIKRLMLPLAAALALTVALTGTAFAATNPDGSHGANKAEANCAGILTSYNQAYDYSVSNAIHLLQDAAAAGDVTAGQLISTLAQTTPPDPAHGFLYCDAVLQSLLAG